LEIKDSQIRDSISEVRDFEIKYLKQLFKTTF
jgi:hypothetical protein